MSGGRPRTARRCGVPVRAIWWVAVAAVALAMGGCLFAEPERAGMTIRNESRAELSVFVNENTAPRATVRSGEVRRMGIGREGTCVEWLLTARTADGADVATLGPPVCDEDEWMITQEDVDRAMAGD